MSAFHRNATSLVERFTMGDVCLTAWKRKNAGLPFPGIRLTRCCVRLIFCRRCCMDEVGFLPDFFGRGTLPGVPLSMAVSYCEQTGLSLNRRFKMKKIFPGRFFKNRLTKSSVFPYNHTCFTAFT